MQAGAKDTWCDSVSHPDTVCFLFPHSAAVFQISWPIWALLPEQPLGFFFWPCKEYLALSLWTDLEFSPAIDHYSVHVIIFHCTIISHIWLLFVFAPLITYIRHMLVSSESIIQTIQLFFLSKSVAKVIKLNCKKKDSLTVSLKDWKDLVTCAYLILWDSCTPYKLGSLWGTNAES